MPLKDYLWLTIGKEDFEMGSAASKTFMLNDVNADGQKLVIQITNKRGKTICQERSHLLKWNWRLISVTLSLRVSMLCSSVVSGALKREVSQRSIESWP